MQIFAYYMNAQLLDSLNPDR